MVTVDEFRESVWFSPTTNQILTVSQLFCASIDEETMIVRYGPDKKNFTAFGKLHLTLALPLDNYEFIGYLC